MDRLCTFCTILSKELRDVLAGQTIWVLLLLLSVLVGYSYIQAVTRYAEASDQALLTALMEALVKLLMQGAGAFTRFFDGANKTGIAAKLAFMEVHGRWCERFYARPFDQAGMDEMCAMLVKLP